jgi:hypothetical protein
LEGVGEIDMKIRSELDARESVEHVEVMIQTPKGTWPTEGFVKVPVVQRVALQLHHAATSLRIEDTESWVASADGVRINPFASYRENGLTKRAFIRYQPSEGT